MRGKPFWQVGLRVRAWVLGWSCPKCRSQESKDSRNAAQGAQAWKTEVDGTMTMLMSTRAPSTLNQGVRIKGTLGDIDPLNKVPFERAISRG